MSSTSFLLQGGTLLLHDSLDHIIPTKADLLIRDSKIAHIAPSITPLSTYRIISCTGKLVTPGFIDTHRHLWQTQLKGRHANELLLDYMPTGNMAASLFSPRDIYWGELGGALESIDAGTTTIVDHAHMNYSREHTTEGLKGMIEAGVRGIFAYGANPRVTDWEEFSFEEDVIPEWFMHQLHQLAGQKYGDGRVQVGLAWDTWYLPKEVVSKIFEQAREWGVKLITSHYVRGPTMSMLPIETMVSWDLLGPDILISHATNATSEEASQLVKAGAHISTTPSTELQMSLGDPICFHPDFHSISSLGIDCHTATSADIPGQMRLALQSARGRRNQRILNSGKTPASIEHQVEQAFNLGTIMGARAIGMGNELGSLEVGKFADLVVWDGMSPGMVCAVEQDPVAAVVLHSSVRDVEMVMIDGVVRKEGGKLCPVNVGGKDMPWGDVARELLRSREEIEKKVQQIDYEKAKKGMIKAFYIQEDTLSHE